MKDKIFESFLSESFFSDSVTLILEVEDFLEPPACSWDVYLELSFLEGKKESLKFFPLKRKEESPYFILTSETIFSSCKKKAIRARVFVEQDLYTRVRVCFFELTKKISRKKIKEILGKLAPWGVFLSEELKKKTPSERRLFSLFQVARLLGVESWAFLLAKQIQVLSASAGSSFLEVNHFLERLSFSHQLRGFCYKKLLSGWARSRRVKSHDGGAEKLCVFLTRKKFQSTDKFPKKNYNGSCLVLRTLGVSLEEKSSEIVQLKEQEGFLEVSKPFASFEDLEKVPLLKQLELDFYLSCQILESWCVTEIFWDSSFHDVYIDFLGSCLRKTFLVSES